MEIHTICYHFNLQSHSHFSPFFFFPLFSPPPPLTNNFTLISFSFIVYKFHARTDMYITKREREREREIAFSFIYLKYSKTLLVIYLSFYWLIFSFLRKRNTISLRKTNIHWVKSERRKTIYVRKSLYCKSQTATIIDLFFIPAVDCTKILFLAFAKHSYLTLVPKLVVH